MRASRLVEELCEAFSVHGAETDPVTFERCGELLVAVRIRTGQESPTAGAVQAPGADEANSAQEEERGPSRAPSRSLTDRLLLTIQLWPGSLKGAITLSDVKYSQPKAEIPHIIITEKANYHTPEVREWIKEQSKIRREWIEGQSQIRVVTLDDLKDAPGFLIPSILQAVWTPSAPEALDGDATALWAVKQYERQLREVERHLISYELARRALERLRSYDYFWQRFRDFPVWRPRHRFLADYLVLWDILGAIKEICTEGPRFQIAQETKDISMALVEAHEHAAVLGRDRRKLYVTDKPSDAYDAINSVRSLVYVYGAGFSATRMNPSRDREAIDKDRHDLLRYLNPEDWRYPEEFCVTFIDRILRVGSSYWWKRLPGLVDADNASTLDPVAHGVFRFLDGMAIELWRMPAYSSSQTLRTASERLLGAYRVFYNTVKEVLLSSKDESYDRLHIAMGQFARIVYWVVGRYEAATLLEKIHLHFNPAVLRRCIMHFLRPRASALSKGDISAFCATDGRLVWTCIDKQGTYLQDYTHANHQWRGWLAGCQKKLDEKAVSASNHAHLVLGLIPPNVRDVVGGIWESVNLLNRGNIEMIARTLCGSRRIQPPSSYDRVVAIARAGAVFGTLLAVTENKQLSLLNIRPAWHCRPYPSVLERLLIVDDQVLTGFTMAAAEQGFLDQWFCRRNLTWLALAKCKVFDRGDALNPVQFANIHGHLKTFEDCRTLAAYDLADENVQIANAQFIQPTIDITDHVESSEALAMQSRLESVFERCREPENVEEMREDLQKRITKTCLARQRNLVERTSPWRERLFGYSAKRFYKPELLFNEPSLLLQIARYFYWTEVRPRDIRVIIATSGAALPIATCLGLLSMWFEEKGMGPRLSIMLAQQGGSHIVGLSQYANDRKRHGGKFATLATVFGAGRRDRMIQESLAAFRWPQKAVHDKDCCGERGEKAGFKRDMILAVFDYQPLQCSERPAVPIKSIVEIKE